jgi:hypothetical protein
MPWPTPSMRIMTQGGSQAAQVEDQARPGPAFRQPLTVSGLIPII